MILSELKTKLEKLGIKRGDVLCVFSDVTSFGIPQEAREGVSRLGLPHLLASYVETFQSVLGEEGTLLMPTFTYSACEKEPFIVEETPSQVGALTEFFRQGEGITRSFHPIFSFCGWGNLSAEILKVDHYDCFGEDSFFGKMIRSQGKYLLFGTSLQRAGTFIYYSLQKMKVPYRYFKTFPANIKNGKEELTVEVPYFVRNLELKQHDHWQPLEELAVEKGIVNRQPYSSGQLLLTTSGEIDSLTCQELKRDPNFLIRKAL